MPVDLGKKVQVNVDRFLEALAVLKGDHTCSQEFANVFNMYGISGTTDVYTGSSSSDGAVIFRYTVDSAPNFLSLRKIGGQYSFYEGIFGSNAVVKTNDTCASFAISLITSGKVNDFSVGVIDGARKCVIGNECSSGEWNEALKNIEIEKKEIEMAQMSAEAKQVEDAKKDAIEHGIRCAQMAKDILKKVIAADNGPGGINSDDVADIINEYDLTPPIYDLNLANDYEQRMESMLSRILNTKSAIDAMSENEQGPVSGCKLYETRSAPDKNETIVEQRGVRCTIGLSTIQGSYSNTYTPGPCGEGEHRVDRRCAPKTFCDIGEKRDRWGKCVEK